MDNMKTEKPEQSKPEANTGQAEDPTKVTDDEQAMYERAVNAGIKVLYAEETHEDIMNMLTTGADNPGKTLADVAHLIMTQVDKEANGKIPETMILPAAAEILELTAELANTAGVVQVDQTVLDQATQELLLQLADSYGVSPEEIQALIDSLDPADVQSMVAQQGQSAQSGGQEAAAGGQQQAAPEQEQTGMINQQVAGGV